MIYAPIFLALIAPIAAQSSSNWTLPADFDLSQVDSTTRANWCLAERNNCPKICGGVAIDNRCDQDTLNFTCTCSNGTDANVGLYEGTIPFFVCQQEYAQCIQQSTTQEGDDVCKEGLNSCGSLNASAATTTSTTTTTTTTVTSQTSTASGDSSNTEATATGSSDSPTETDGAMRLMQNYGIAGFATVVVAAFALL